LHPKERYRQLRRVAKLGKERLRREGDRELQILAFALLIDVERGFFGICV
jgi:hypothetical protein